MQLSALVLGLFVLFATQGAAQSGGCNCTSPTGCPGLCSQIDGSSYCNNDCGYPGEVPCAACAGLPAPGQNSNCYFDSTGVCHLWTF
ncbi:uncharacterized protein PHACADRAFT_265957 [Phanerochaete carnosa HHB-10118-sp]|uniref:Uncharacterized protein n=1 Tax=Phanerochaete carnosa (strain HHB-10118-sp) TaxID=650164 RepID=K5UHH7_PHACS|nr:uncharacterized protein PHACADRAFT_265957 [Phanerochaete carnosa HHB-10118-sp]EKM48956.1 hypothetical protein PHACADRAFT_265957 [Phanerochaete carnosa HHB-10118-sp]